MENISNQLSYVKGLMEGMKFDDKSNEGKIFKALLSVFLHESLVSIYQPCRSNTAFFL